jgi:diamine N-acetyltransferase
MNGPNVYLRALEPDDVEILYQWENDHTLWHLSNTVTPLSRFTLEQYIMSAGQDIYATRQFRLMIDLVSPQDGIKTIGSIDLFEYEPAHQRAGVGILIHEKFRGKGYASEALGLLITYARETLQLHQLFANISGENSDSIRLFENRGFSYIGTKKEWNRIRNRWYNESMFQLILQPDNHT